MKVNISICNWHKLNCREDRMQILIYTLLFGIQFFWTNLQILFIEKFIKKLKTEKRKMNI